MAPRILKPQGPRAETMRHRKVIFTSTKKRRRSGVRLETRSKNSATDTIGVYVIQMHLSRADFNPHEQGSTAPRIKVSCPAGAWGTFSLHVQQEQLLHSQYPLHRLRRNRTRHGFDQMHDRLDRDSGNLVRRVRGDRGPGEESLGTKLPVRPRTG